MVPPTGVLDDGGMTEEPTTPDRLDGATDAESHPSDANMETADSDTMTATLADAETGTSPDPGSDSNPDQPDEPTEADTMPPTDQPYGSQPPPTDPTYRGGAAGGHQADLGLVRDPQATFGGVASGVAHRYGWSIPLLRLGFVAGFLATGGAAVLLYLVAWLIIPRARFWPPTRVAAFGGGVRSRDLGIAIAVVGVLAFLIAGGGGSASFLVPLALVVGGIWLLIQDTRTPAGPVGEHTAAAGAAGPPPPPPHVDSFATQPGPIGQPVPPRSRSKWVLRVLIALLLAAVLATAAAVAGFVLWAEEDGFQLEFSTQDFSIGGTNIDPESLDELPDSIETDLGFVDIDLTNLTSSDFDDADLPVSLTIDIGDGEVSLDLPEWLDYSLVAEVQDGEIDLDGVDLVDLATGSDRVVVESDDPLLDIVILLDDGRIDIDVDR